MALALAPAGPVVGGPWKCALLDRERSYGRCLLVFGGFFGLFELAVAV